MINRRNTLKLGVTTMASGLANFSANALAATAKNQTAQMPQGVFDSTYSQSKAFAKTLSNKGISAFDIKDNLSSLWYDELRASLAENPRPLFGLTDRLSLFCIEELARDLNLKVHTRIDHLIDQHGKVEHLAASDVLNEATKLLNTDFGRQIAGATELTEKPAADQSSVSAQKLTGPNGPANKTALVSWVIS